ncbi:MAG: hypothetical protein QME51_04600 [Planctomycetota bacterium]|nr:hypothetical protein [Planctomycetota bacterium]MDI6787631.1 hypothetical protein [Planctomycetota bacterium]
MRYHYRSFNTPGSLFRRISPNLLYEYFKSRKVLDDFAWDSYIKNKWHLMEDLVEEFYKMPVKKREEIEEELRQVNSLAGLSAQETLEAVAMQFKLVWDDEMMPEDRTLTVLMENKDAFLTACNWANLEDYESFADYVAKPKEPKEWSRIKQPLTDAWKLLLQSQSNGYGRVYIEHYTATDRQAYLVYYEAPKTYITRFDDRTDQPEEKADKPVLEALLIYYPKTGNLCKLKIKAKTDTITERARDDYAKLALGDEHYFATGSERIYDMNLFKKKLEPIDFPTDPADRISSVRVVTIRFKPDALTKDIVEITSVKGLKERIRLLKLDLTTAVIKKVRLQVKFEGVQKGLVKSFNLSIPNKNTLGDSKKDRLIEGYLVKWGVANR